MEEFVIHSGRPFAGLTVGVAQFELLITVCSISLNGSETVFVRLARRLYQGDQQNEAEEEQELVFITINGVHAIQRKWLAETLIAHVERSDEAKFFHTINYVTKIEAYPERWSGL